MPEACRLHLARKKGEGRRRRLRKIAMGLARSSVRRAFRFSVDRLRNREGGRSVHLPPFFEAKVGDVLGKGPRGGRGGVMVMESDGRGNFIMYCSWMPAQCARRRAIALSPSPLFLSLFGSRMLSRVVQSTDPTSRPNQSFTDRCEVWRASLNLLGCCTIGVMNQSPNLDTNVPFFLVLTLSPPLLFIFVGCCCCCWLRCKFQA